MIITQLKIITNLHSVGNLQESKIVLLKFRIVLKSVKRNARNPKVAKDPTLPEEQPDRPVTSNSSLNLVVAKTFDETHEIRIMIHT